MRKFWKYKGIIFVLTLFGILILNFSMEKFIKYPIDSRRYIIIINGFRTGEEKVERYYGYLRLRKVVKTEREIKILLRKKGNVLNTYECYLFVENIDRNPLFYRSKKAFGYKDVIESFGKVKNNALFLKVKGSYSRKIPVQKPFLFPSGIEDAMNKKNIKPNSKFIFKVFDPSFERIVDLSIKIGATENINVSNTIYKLFKAEGIFYYPTQPVKFYAWIDKNGRTYKVYYPSLKMEKVLEKISPEKGIEILEISKISCIRPISGIIQFNPRNIKELEIKIENMNIKMIKNELVASSDLQKIVEEGDNFVILNIRSKDYSERLSNISIFSIEEGKKQYLKHTIYSQSDVKEIKNIASKISKGETNILYILRKINNYIIENLHYQPHGIDVAFARPKEILALKYGDCTELSVLFVAIARAIGIPSRVVSGVIYNNDCFAYHMWVQVWCNEWIDIDPAFQQIGIDATHIAFSTSDLTEESTARMDLVLSKFIFQTKYAILKARI